MPKIAAFIDRDGTINDEVGYVNHLCRFKIYPWAPEAIKNLNNKGLKTIVVSNQAGVARDYFPEDLVIQIHSNLQQEMVKSGAYFDAIYYCPHHPSIGQVPYRKVCNCRKLKPRMLLKTVNKFGTDIAKSFLIGDRYSDIQLDHDSGARSIFVLSDYGRREYEHHRHS